jgi:hypothetical protein
MTTFYTTLLLQVRESFFHSSSICEITIANIAAPHEPFLCSYLRMEEHVIPLEMLVELEGDYGEHLMLRNESVRKLVACRR